MTERSQPAPTEDETSPEPLPKTADYRYDYRGFWQSEGHCPIRVFEAAGRAPDFLVAKMAKLNLATESFLGATAYLEEQMTSW